MSTEFHNHYTTYQQFLKYKQILYEIILPTAKAVVFWQRKTLTKCENTQVTRRQVLILMLEA